MAWWATPTDTEGGDARSNGCATTTIICGYGRVGRRVAAELRASGKEYVVVDVNADALEAAQADGSLVVLGDGTEDGDLERAGIRRARRAGRVGRLGRDQPLHHALREGDRAGALRRRARAPTTRPRAS